MINILGVSASGVILLSAHDYSNCYKTDTNIADALIKTIQEIGPYNVIQVMTDNAANCKETRAIIEDKYPNIFWLECLVHTMNLMHDIIEMKDHDYRWMVFCTREEEDDKIYYQSYHGPLHFLQSLQVGVTKDCKAQIC